MAHRSTRTPTPANHNGRNGPQAARAGVKRPAAKRAAEVRRAGNVTARVYQALRQQILEGQLAPGAHLSQQAIAKEMQTSNGPVITALRRLAHEGLVSHERGHGCRVSDFGEEKLDDFLTVRRALETEAARLAARRAGAEDFERLHAIVDRMAELVREGRRLDGDLANKDLHLAIARLSRSPGLIEALERCHVLDLVRRRRQANERFGDFRNLAVNHRALVEAIASGDADRAAQAMHDHLRSKRRGSPTNATPEGQKKRGRTAERHATTP